MTIQDQVVSLELAKQLKEASYPQKGLWWWCIGKEDKVTMLLLNKPEKDTMLPLNKPSNGHHYIQEIREVYVAPTVAELGDKLVKTRLPLPAYDNRKIKWWCIINGMPRMESNTEADARAKMWLYLKKEGLL